MSTASPNNVVRYCPECGRKFNAPEKQFESPRICPACKTRVLFLAYQIPPDIPDVPTAPLDRPTLTKNMRYATLGISFAAAGVLLVGMLAAAVTGNFTAFFAMSCVFLVAGIAGMSTFLEMSGKAHATKVALAVREQQLKAADANQIKYLTLYFGLKRNFDAIVSDEKSGLQSEWQQRLDMASKELERAKQERETAGEQIAKEKTSVKAIVEVYQNATHKMADRMLKEVRKSIKSRLNANNFATSKDRFMDAVDFCEKRGYSIPPQMIADFVAELEQDYEQAVRVQLAKEEQARIKERMREEAKAEKELAKELIRSEAEEYAIRKAIDEALLRSTGEQSAEIESLRQRLAEAEARAERAKSMAQMTKAGHVYVISNIGSLGDDVFKIGMTRRLEPLERVRELSDASVPFPFDVHMMISSDNAPALEATLHREFHRRRLNRVNFRKEFFKVSVDEISAVVQRECGVVDYMIEPEAMEYRESLTLSEADFDFISSQVNPESLAED